jgi:hypothetical protein
MDSTLLSLMLCLMLLLGGYELLRHGTPRVTPCRHCGDLVQAPPGLPVRCPSCRRFLVA